VVCQVGRLQKESEKSVEELLAKYKEQVSTPWPHCWPLASQPLANSLAMSRLLVSVHSRALSSG